MKQETSEQVPYGELLPKDVFVHDGIAYQKLSDGRAYDPEQKNLIDLGKNIIVDYVGMGIWPSVGNIGRSNRF